MAQAALKLIDSISQEGAGQSNADREAHMTIPVCDIVDTWRTNMAEMVRIEVEVPGDVKRFTLPAGVKQRLQRLLDRQDQGEALTPDERVEAAGLVDIAELLSLFKLRARRVSKTDSPCG